MNRFGKGKKGCFTLGCLCPTGLVILSYGLWAFWTGWLGPDRLETAGVSLLGKLVAGKSISADVRRASAKGTEGWLELLERPIPRSLQRPCVGSEDPEVATGQRLPREMDAAAYGNAQRWMMDDELLRGEYVIRNLLEYRYSRGLEQAIVRLWEADAPEYPEWLAARADVLPPRRVDTAIHFCAHLGYREKSLEYWGITRPAWRRMSSGRNPYYRLLALRWVAQWAEDPEEQRAVLLKAFEEADDAFLVYALWAMKALKTSDPKLVAEAERVAREHPGGSDDTALTDVKALAAEVLKSIRDQGEIESSSGENAQ